MSPFYLNYSILIIKIISFRKYKMYVTFYSNAIDRGNLCTSVEDTGAPWEPSTPVSALERDIIDREVQLRLCNVKFEIFERTIKRFGYTGKLTDATLTEIKNEI